jgi:coenzyme F420-reducing hydrogenase alpha subunit
MGGRVYSLSEFYGPIARSVQEEYSTALHYRLYGVESYVVGPIARFNSYHHALSEEARELLESHGWRPPVTPAEFYVARVAEIVDALVRLRGFLEEYRPPSRPRAIVEGVVEEPATCEYAVEAPRGVLYGRFVVGRGLKLLSCDLVTPTAQNLAAMGDIATEILRGKPLSEEAVRLAKSVAVAFDPCISCSVHALRVRIVRLR